MGGFGGAVEVQQHHTRCGLSGEGTQMTEPLQKGSLRTGNDSEIRLQSGPEETNLSRPHHTLAQNDQCAVGIILSNLCGSTQDTPLDPPLLSVFWLLPPEA